MKRYLIRALKSLIMFFGMALLIFMLAFYLGNVQKNHPDLTFWEFAKLSNLRQMGLFLGLFGLVYPMVGFVRKKIYTNGSLAATQKQQIIDMFSRTNYELEKDENMVLTFRYRTKHIRFMRLLYEDAIRVNYSGNPLIMDGLRKDVFRLSRGIEYTFRMEAELE